MSWACCCLSKTGATRRSPSCREAVRLNPGCAEAHNNLGFALAGQEQMDEAVACYPRGPALNAPWRTTTWESPCAGWAATRMPRPVAGRPCGSGPITPRRITTWRWHAGNGPAR